MHCIAKFLSSVASKNRRNNTVVFGHEQVFMNNHEIPKSI